jgi:hypothetical protein
VLGDKLDWEFSSCLGGGLSYLSCGMVVAVRFGFLF